MQSTSGRHWAHRIMAGRASTMPRQWLRLCVMVALIATALLMSGTTAYAADFIVNSTADDVDQSSLDGLCLTAQGECTLRAALDEALANGGGADTISFNIPGPGPHTISIGSNGPLTPLNNVTIDGYTQPSASPNTLTEGNDAVILIEIDGGALQISGRSEVRGLAISNCSATCIVNFAVGTTIAGNFIGLNSVGKSSSVSPGDGVYDAGSYDVMIGGPLPADRNVIGNVAGFGIRHAYTEESSDQIIGNYIGTDPTGTQARPNGLGGINAGEDSVEGLLLIENNLISGNNGPGIFADFLYEVNGDLEINGNFIGTDAFGNPGLPNSGSGIQVLLESSNVI
ncbi:MAG: CSLREA domain-containing protein, partial [Caldilineaceae bacterium]|nr:CSLREA domain-containing protein [Caldilineaceae bacterium]